jgi:hypothetical protein
MADIGVANSDPAERDWNCRLPDGERQMIEIAAAACLISAPERCRDVSLTVEASSRSSFACMFDGQVRLAQWTETHPNWRITRFTCREAGTVGKI